MDLHIYALVSALICSSLRYIRTLISIPKISRHNVYSVPRLVCLSYQVRNYQDMAHKKQNITVTLVFTSHQDNMFV